MLAVDSREDSNMSLNMDKLAEDYRLREVSAQVTNPADGAVITSLSVNNEGFVTGLQLDASATARFELQDKDSSGDVVSKRPFVIGSDGESIEIDGELVKSIPDEGSMEFLLNLTGGLTGDVNVWIQVAEKR